MSRFPFDDDTADRLLSGELAPGDAPPGYARLAEVVRAAQGPASPSELAMEASVVAAVGEAVRSIPGIRRSPNRRKSMLGKLASAKIAAIAATTVLGGTVAAAATGSLPGPAQHAASVALSQVGINVSNGSHGHGKGHSPGTAPGLVGNKHADYGLCQAWNAHVSAGATATGGWMNSTAFQTFAQAVTANAGTTPTSIDCSQFAPSGAATPGATNDNGHSNGSSHGKSGAHKPSTAGTRPDDSNTTETSEPAESDNASVPSQGSTHATAGAQSSSVGTHTASTAAGVTRSGRP